MTELDVIKKKIRVRLNELADLLADGHAQSYDEYRYMVGQVHGLALVERDILDFQEATHTED